MTFLLCRLDGRAIPFQNRTAGFIRRDVHDEADGEVKDWSANSYPFDRDWWREPS
jgi:hypothetical protein